MRHLATVAGIALLACCAAARPAAAACPAVDAEVAAAQTALRAAEPARDASVADFERRLALVQTAYDAAARAESIRSTTPGGCGDLQQVYAIAMTHAWADLLFAYLKPSLEFYIPDPACRLVSQLHTISIVVEADETMRRSLISWNPVDVRVEAVRDHVTKLVDEAASFLKIDVPPSDTAEDAARLDKFRWDVARSRAPADCAAAITDPNVPKPLSALIFAPSS